MVSVLFFWVNRDSERGIRQSRIGNFEITVQQHAEVVAPGLCPLTDPLLEPRDAVCLKPIEAVALKLTRSREHPIWKALCHVALAPQALHGTYVPDAQRYGSG